MHEYSRRALLASGGLLVGSTLLSTSTVGSSGPATAEGPRVRPTATPVPVRPLDAPTQIASLLPTTCGAVMQQVERATTGDLFMTQSLSGSAPGRYTTVVTRFAGDPAVGAGNVELDAMTVLDGGHGLGLHVERADDHDFVWASLQGPVSQGDPNGGRLARFLYTPGVYAIEAIPGGVQYLPQLPNADGELQEAIYSFDWAQGVAVERMYDFHTGRHERFTLRRISDLLSGVDRPEGRMTLPVNAPTMQGFATAGATFYRWVGLGNSASGVGVPGDPMALERYDWSTGTRIAVQGFPTLGQTDGAWPEGAYEPEGCSVHREADGSATLLVGVTVGVAGDHRWLVFAFPDVDAA